MVKSLTRAIEDPFQMTISHALKSGTMLGWSQTFGVPSIARGRAGVPELRVAAAPRPFGVGRQRIPRRAAHLLTVQVATVRAIGPARERCVGRAARPAGVARGRTRVLIVLVAARASRPFGVGGQWWRRSTRHHCSRTQGVSSRRTERCGARERTSQLRAGGARGGGAHLCR